MTLYSPPSTLLHVPFPPTQSSTVGDYETRRSTTGVKGVAGVKGRKYGDEKGLDFRVGIDRFVSVGRPAFGQRSEGSSVLLEGTRTGTVL